MLVVRDNREQRTSPSSDLLGTRFTLVLEGRKYGNRKSHRFVVIVMMINHYDREGAGSPKVQGNNCNSSHQVNTPDVDTLSKKS